MPGQGDHRRLPPDVGDRGVRARLRRLSRRGPRPATFFHGHSYGGNALAAAVALRHLRPLDEWDVLANVASPARSWRRLLDREGGAAPRRAASSPAGPDGRGSSWPRARPGLRWGRRVCAAAVAAWRAAAATGRRRGGDAAAHRHRRRDLPHRRRPGGRPRRGHGRRPGRPRPATAGPLGGDGAHRAPAGRAGRRPTSRRRWPAEGRWRSPRTFDARGAGRYAWRPSGTVVSFASNDYLGLSAHPAVVAAAHAALERWGAGAGASRLVTGSRPVHAELEEDLAAWKGGGGRVSSRPGSPPTSGPPVLGGLGGRILSDELNHASIIDGCRLARAEVAVYRHADPDHVDAPAGAARATGRGRHRHGLLDGRRAPRSPSWPRPAAATGPSSSSTRPTPSSARTPVPR